MNKVPSLKQAQRLILDLAQPTTAETVTLDNALGLVTATPLKANLPVPSFDHSTRDGYALKSRDLKPASVSNPVTLRVTGEIQAGCTELPSLATGQALRIMTGGAIPPGSDLVMAQEDVEINSTTIIVNQSPPAGSFVRKKGSAIARGRVIVRAGTTLAPDHLALLATAGTGAIKAHRKPAAAVICTGSELIPQGKTPRPGQVISSNRLLLDGLIKSCGGITTALTTAPDQGQEIATALKSFLTAQVPLIITTGGMGPGKFDLMAEVFSELKIKTIYNALEVKPGRATMLGIHGKSLVFAMPGPPPAVRLLFNELIKPALLKIGGARTPLNKLVRAELTESIYIRPGNFLHLKGGVSFIEGGKLRVNLADRTEKINCVIHLPPGRRHLKNGELVAIHPTTAAF
ncbi:MAG: molybdopterin molybdotransferase MoeA [Desulfobulbaceae bacterium]|nr:molybdopterin molybdotransferase MoeA [Desulfobulbaceae bacterium]